MQNYKSCAKKSASKEKVENGEKKEKVTTVHGVVEAVTERYGGGVRLAGMDFFYNLAKGVELPEKGIEIVAQVRGRTLLSWKRVVGDSGEEGCEVADVQEDERDESKGVKLPDDIKVSENVRAVTDTFLAILKYLDERVPDMDTRDRLIVASVIFKEIMETKRSIMLVKVKEEHA